MPVLRMSGLPQKDPAKISAALKKVCLALADVCGCDPKHVWATWQDIAPDLYVEGDQAATAQPDQTHPPIGQLFCYGQSTHAEIEKLLSVAATTLGEALGLGDNIFITYHSVPAGTVFDGGKVR